MKSPKDPVDHARTTRPHAGETMKDTKNVPALIVLGVALVLFVACLAAFGTAHADSGAILAVLAAVGFIAGGAWLVVEHRRVRGVEQRWHAQHPGNRGERPAG